MVEILSALGFRRPWSNSPSRRGPWPVTRGPGRLRGALPGCHQLPKCEWRPREAHKLLMFGFGVVAQAMSTLFNEVSTKRGEALSAQRTSQRGCRRAGQ